MKKITLEIEIDICNLLKEGYKLKEIADKFNVKIGTISKIRKKYDLQRKKISQETEELIKKDLTNNVEIKIISEKYNISLSSLLKLRKKYNFNIQSYVSKTQENLICEKLIHTNCAETKLAKEFNVSPATIRNIRSRNNISKKTQRSDELLKVDENYFENINTADKAYYLGWITSDGCINNNYYLQIGLSSKDIEFLKKFKENIKSEHKISIRKNGKYELSVFAISCKKICLDLAKHGVTKDKSKILNFPKTIQEEFLSDYLRGLFEGDGTWNIYQPKNPKKRPAIQFGIYSPVLNFLVETQEYLMSKLNLNKTKIFPPNKKDTCFKLVYCGNVQVKKLYDFMYKNANLKLERKFLRATEYFKQNGKL